MPIGFRCVNHIFRYCIKPPPDASITKRGRKATEGYSGMGHCKEDWQACDYCVAEPHNIPPVTVEA